MTVPFSRDQFMVKIKALAELYKNMLYKLQEAESLTDEDKRLTELGQILDLLKRGPTDENKTE